MVMHMRVYAHVVRMAVVSGEQYVVFLDIEILMVGGNEEIKVRYGL